MATSVTVYDGAEGIGGNKVEIRDDVLDPATGGVQTTRILLDFGANMPRQDKYFDQPFPDYDKNSENYGARLKAMLRLGILPTALGMENYADRIYVEKDKDKAPTPTIQAIFLSHAHQDHNGCIGYLNPKIKLIATPETLCFHRIANIPPKGSSTKKANSESCRLTQEIGGGESTTVGSITVTAVRVDHSMPGCCAFLIQTSDARIVYTGDFRHHGASEHYAWTENFIMRAADSRPALLICEGTNVDEYKHEAEEAHGVPEPDSGSLKDFLATEVDRSFRHDGMVFANVSAKELDRIDTLYEVVRESSQRDATFHVSAYNARLLVALAKTGAYDKEPDHIVRQFDLPAIQDKRVEIDSRVRIYERYTGELDKSEPELSALRTVFEGRIHPIGAYATEPQLRQSAVVLLYGNDIELLDKIAPPPRSKYIQSVSEAFTEELVADNLRLRAWVDSWGLTYHQMHVSGHVHAAKLKQDVERINPTYLLPLHTLHRDLFRDTMADPADCLLVTPGEPVRLSELLQKKAIATATALPHAAVKERPRRHLRTA